MSPITMKNNITRRGRGIRKRLLVACGMGLVGFTLSSLARLPSDGPVYCPYCQPRGMESSFDPAAEPPVPAVVPVPRPAAPPVAPVSAPNPAPPPVTPPTAVATPVAGAATLALDFAQLSFTPAKDPVSTLTGQPHYIDQTPPAILAYNGRKVRISGYMVPVSMEGDAVREFMIMANQMSCCYGTPPRFCEFIVARMKNEATPIDMDSPRSFEGILKVGDVFANGYWTQFYTLDCDTVTK